MILLYDNARPYVTKLVKETLEALYWEMLPHAAYSPDCAPSDTVTCFDQWHTHLQRNTSILMKTSKNGSLSEKPPKMSHSFAAEFACLKDGKKSSLTMDNILIKVLFHFVF